MSLLRLNRMFARVWAAGLCFMLAWWALHAVMLIHVFDLTGSPFATSLIPVFSSLPGILLGPVAGVLVDRWSRQRVMAGCALALVVMLLVSLPFAVDANVWLLYAIIFIQSMVMTFHSPAESALLPSLVEEDDLRTANSLNALNDGIGRVAGPAIGATLLVAQGLAVTLLVSAVIYFVGWLLLRGVKDPRSARLAGLPAPGTRPEPVWRSFHHGIAIVRGSPVIGLLVAVSALILVADVPLSAVLPAFMRESVGVSAEFFGNTMSVRGVTGIMGGLILVALSRRVHETWLLAGGLLVHGISYFVLGAANSVVMSVLVLIPIGPAWAAVETGLLTLVQKHAPDEVRGRVFALMGTVNGIVVLTVSISAGALAEVTGTRAIVMASGLLHLLPLIVAIVLLRMVGPVRSNAARPVAVP
jgi:predicted MFS family arabinose efflux permease